MRTTTAHDPRTAGSVVIRINTNRASRTLATALGRKPQYWFTVKDGGMFVVLTAQEATAVLPIKGITRPRVNRNELGQCI